MASHTLNDEEYQKLLEDRRCAEVRASELEAEIKRVREEDPANRVEPLRVLARHMLTIVRFAVANLPPVEIRGWPTKDLFAIADRLATLPDYNVSDDAVLMNELRAFADECESYALSRASERAEKSRSDASAVSGEINAG